MSKTNPLEKIKEHRAAIEALTAEAVQTLRTELQSYKDQAARVEAEIAELTGKPEKAASGSRGTRTKITIEQVKQAIKAGATNYPAIAKALGCSTANVSAKIKAEGKAAGITKTGERATMALHAK